MAGGSWELPDRQQTLRATLDWSYDLLGAGEQRLLARLAVFAGGWTLEAAEAVCADDDTRAQSPSLPSDQQPAALARPGEVLDLLAGLVAKSLAQVGEREGQGRYGLLETVRQYGQERLRASGEGAAARDRHLAHFLLVAERAEPELTGPEQGVWLARLEREHDNLRAALAWARERGKGEEGLRLAGALWRFWFTRGYLAEGRRWLAGALAGEGSASAARARALHAAGALAHHQDDYAQAMTYFEEGLVLRRALGDERGIADSLGGLGTVAYMQGDFGRATALTEEALVLHRRLGDRPGVARSLNNLGEVAYQQGDYGRATAMLSESLRLWRDLGFRQGFANTLSYLGIIARVQGNAREALALLRESLAVRRDLQEKPGILECLEEIALVQHEALPELAARLLGAAERLRGVIGYPLSAGQAAHFGALIAVRSALREGTFAPAWAVGQAMSPEQAVAEALAGDPGG
jgi:non-specific serine/threonine protein kinase